MKLLILLGLVPLCNATWMNPRNVSRIFKDEAFQYVQKQLEFHNQTATEANIKYWTQLTSYPCVFKTAPFELKRVCPNGCEPGHWDYGTIYIKWCSDPVDESFGGVGCCVVEGTEFNDDRDAPERHDCCGQKPPEGFE